MARGNAPNIKAAPSGTRKPSVAVSPDDFMEQPIAWRFSTLDSGGKGKCSIGALDAYAASIVKYETMTRREIEGKKHCHPCSPSKLSPVGRKRLEIMQLDVDTLYQLDFATPCRLWGFWTRNVFNIVWLDKNHDFYSCK